MVELLSEGEARQTGLKFLQGIYYRGKISLTQAELVTSGAFPMYQLEGTIKIASRNLLGKLISSDAPYTFKMQVHATDGSVLNYEVR